MFLLSPADFKRLLAFPAPGDPTAFEPSRHRRPVPPPPSPSLLRRLPAAAAADGSKDAMLSPPELVPLCLPAIGGAPLVGEMAAKKDSCKGNAPQNVVAAPRNERGMGHQGVRTPHHKQTNNEFLSVPQLQ